MTYSLRPLLLGVLTATLVLAAPIESQRSPQGRRGGVQNREQLEQRIRAQMGRMMRERLALTEEQSEQLSEVVQRFQSERRELFRIEQATRRRVEALMLEGGNDEEEATELLTRMTDLRAQEAELFAAEQVALLEVLSPIQVLQMQSIREQIGQRIRALGGGRGDRPGGRRRRGGPGGGETLTPPWG